ncbi:Retrovirus-related Pol polyprotein from transposon TNT 1-94 [Senna tora]|uniref:Retrovirus-related Pol polyprotein from transposon TNT 1-94 n=1 Tax=Senna tora TaxID=362788 RepID=A0A834T510_9FABA|nr:Retrovirus-related Pol polyprotein from transposon TNT 1-94 [Senna tora]
MIPIFNGENYEFWSIKMKTLFKSQDLWDLVEQGFADPDEEGKLKENRKKDSKALFLIQHALHGSLFSRIIGANTSKAAWSTLQKEFQGSSKVKGESSNYSNKGAGRGQGKNGSHGKGGFQDKGNRSFDKQLESQRSEEQKNYKNVQCHYCKKYGHVKENCFKRQKHQASYAEETKEGEKSLFRELDEAYKLTVRLGDDSLVQVKGKGTIALETHGGNVKLLHDVLFVPNLSNNLISVGQLMSSGYLVLFDGDACVIKDK